VKLWHRTKPHDTILGESAYERVDVPGHEKGLDVFDECYGLLGGSRIAIAFLSKGLNRCHVLAARGIRVG
jgi:hypothetical protein